MSSQQTNWHIEGGKREHDYEIWRGDWHLFTIVDAGTCSEPMKNAKLVAAAPSLLSALTNLVNDLDNRALRRYLSHPVVVAAREAIATATGE